MRLLLCVSLAGKIAAVIVGWREPVVALVLWFGPDCLLAYHLFSPYAQGVIPMPGRFRTTEREVWLTIDDGPDPQDTPQLLALLAEHGVQATFFVVGERAARHPELVRAMAAGGHEVAHHTYSHSVLTFWCASPRRVARELDATFAVLRPLGVIPTRFRPPAGIKNPWLKRALRARGLAPVGWRARGLESVSRDPAKVAARVLRNVEPGAILLMHEGPPVPEAIRVAAVRRVLAGLRAQGYRCVVPDSERLGAGLGGGPD